MCNCHPAFTGSACEIGKSYLEVFKVLTLCILYFFVDFDECEAGIHNCRQICNNALNGFTCSCHPGYLLSTDEAHCDGIAKLCIIYIIIPVLVRTTMYVFMYNS